MLEVLDAEQRSRVRACLLGTAVGDALGLPYKGADADEVAMIAMPPSDPLRKHAGSVSDETEQSALVLASLIESGSDIERARAAFRSALLGWVLRLPISVSAATMRACLSILLGRKDTGIASASSEAALRSPVIGACFPYDPARRRALARTFARVTHRDARAVEASVFAAELSALCTQAVESDRATLVLRAACAVQHNELREAIEGAVQLALFKDEALDLKHDGRNVVDTMRVCVWAFVRHGDSPLAAMRAAISVGGATHSAAAIVGGWLGTLHGERSLPRTLLATLHDGPFGTSHLCALVDSVGLARTPRYSRTWAVARNLRSLLWWSRMRLLSR